MDTDLLTAAAIAKAWPEPLTLSNSGIDGKAELFRRAMSDICDTAMPRSRPHNRRAVYWWTQEVQSVRTSCTKARRQFQRAHRKRSRDASQENQLYRSIERLYLTATTYFRCKVPRRTYWHPKQRPVNLPSETVTRVNVRVFRSNSRSRISNTEQVAGHRGGFSR